MDLGTAAVVEIVLGVIAGNSLDLGRPQWLAFLAALGSVVLTFQAGAEIDTAAMRRSLAPSACIGLASLAAEIAGVALSTTSLAVGFAVVVEMGLSDTYIGQLLLSATFVTDLATVAALPATPHGFRRCTSTSEISLPLRVSALGRSSPYDRERKPIGYQDDCQMILLKVPTMACRSSASTPVALP